MEVIHPRCAGINVSKRDAKVCVRVAGRGRKATSSTVTTWTSMASSILALREYLIAERVTCVVVESTAAYWKPFYFLLDDALNVMLVNARHFRNVPGRASRTANASSLAATITPGITCSPSRTVAHITPTPSGSVSTASLRRRNCRASPSTIFGTPTPRAHSRPGSARRSSVIESGTPTSASSCRPTHTSSGNDDREAAEQAASFLIGDGWDPGEVGAAEVDETV